MPPDLLLSQEGVATWPHSGYTLGERWMQKSWVEQCFGKETAAAMQASDAPRPTPLSAPAAAAAEAGASLARGAAMPRRDSRVPRQALHLRHLSHTSDTPRRLSLRERGRRGRPSARAQSSARPPALPPSPPRTAPSASSRMRATSRTRRGRELTRDQPRSRDRPRSAESPRTKSERGGAKQETPH